MFDNVLPTAGAGVQVLTGTGSHWYDLTSLWYDLVAFAAMAMWAAFRSVSRTWSGSPEPQGLPRHDGGDPRGR